MKKCLKIYKASAGSGKTFTLAVEYIKLLIENPYCYRNILAVTFTNKATGEMKERILGKLYGIANRSKGAKDYLKKIREQMPQWSEERIITNARLALELILHDYGHFRIQTIDSFFQSVLRGMARELDLNGDMEISIEGKELLEDTVDKFIRDLEPGKENITQVIRYIEEVLDNGGDWHVEKNIKNFAENILSEEYLDRGEELRRQIEENRSVLEKFRSEVQAKQKECEEKIKELGKEFFALAGDAGPDAFTGNANRGVWLLFTKIDKGMRPKITPTVTKMIENPDKISKIFPDRDKVTALLERYYTLMNEYNSCKLSMAHFHQLGLLNSIAKTLKEENARENRFLLADTAHLLSSMIKSNTSFIFEKIGTEIDHIFIDEFQDTSRLQWVCFEVLLKEVLSRGNFNLIVGDVKQAIYRWRNGDWKIMNNLDSYFKEFNGILEFESQDIRIDGKSYQSVNYRSDRRIISFNNAFYRKAVEVIGTTYKDELGEMYEEISAAYNDVQQAYPQPEPGKPEKPERGFVQVKTFVRGNSKEQSSKEYEAIFYSKLMDTLGELINDKGVKPKDIAILLRENGPIPDIIEEFKTYFPGLKIVSDDAYKLSSSHTVQLAVAAMRYIATPEDKINIANMLNLYNKVVLGNDNPLENYVAKGELIELLPSDFRDNLEHLKGLPTYELIEQLMAILNIEETKGEESYIYAFLDYMSQYINSKGDDLQSLLAAWDESICDKCIPVENDDSLKIMTIHKSKGLEFHTVIMPFCDWKLTADSRSLLWCEPKDEPFDTLELIPVKSVDYMKHSIYNDDYNKEFMYQIVDNLNILYVGTTRAISNLIIFTEERNSDTPYVWQLINKTIEGLPELNGAVKEKREKKEIEYRYGEIVPSEDENGKKESKKEEKNDEKDEKKEDNPFESKPEPLQLPLTFHNNRIEVKQSKELQRFLASEEEKQQLKKIAEGELLHMVMSKIETCTDIDKSLDKLLLQGIIEDAARITEIKSFIEGRLADPRVTEWFNGSYRLYNECTILNRKEKKTSRPDRVMIKGNEAVVVDYKFGYAEIDDNKKQVHDYMELLHAMNYESVKGYVWYVKKNKIIPVTL